MSQIEYAYQVIGVNEEHKSMEIVYSSEGRQTIHVIASLPLVGQTVEEVIRQWVPMVNWLAEEQVFGTAEIGVQGNGAVQLPQEPTTAEIAIGRRNAELSLTDWTQLSDVPMTEEKRAEWVAYRQALRDITEQSGFPDQIVWPVAPV